jgi:hypothetical protein
MVFLVFEAVGLLESLAIEFLELSLIELRELVMVLKWAHQSLDIPLMSDLYCCSMMFI